MYRLLTFVIVLYMSLPAYAKDPNDEAQRQIAAYLEQLDGMCFKKAFLSSGFAQDPGKSWKEGLEKLDAELQANPEISPAVRSTPRLLIHLGLQTIFAKHCLSDSDWDRKNVLDGLGKYADELR